MRKMEVRDTESDEEQLTGDDIRDLSLEYRSPLVRRLGVGFAIIGVYLAVSTGLAMGLHAFVRLGAKERATTVKELRTEPHENVGPAAPQAPREPKKSEDERMATTLNGELEQPDKDQSTGNRSSARREFHVNAKEPEVALTRKHVLIGFKSVAQELRRCHKGVLRRVSLRIVIAPSGLVESAEAIGAYADTSLGLCIADAVQKAQFPPTKRVTIVLHPFLLP
jgi:hypothetical protein